jgi:hypothetical protein
LDRLTRTSIYVGDIQLSDGTKHYKTKTVLLFASTKVGVEVNLKKTSMFKSRHQNAEVSQQKFI